MSPDLLILVLTTYLVGVVVTRQKQIIAMLSKMTDLYTVTKKLDIASDGKKYNDLNIFFVYIKMKGFFFNSRFLNVI